MVKRKYKPVISKEAFKGCLICAYTCEKRGPGILAESGERTAMGGAHAILAEVDEGELRGDVEMVAVDATVTAVELGNAIVVNMVLLGALSGKSELISLDEMRARQRGDANINAGYKPLGF
jgi:Pyruvate/2-oxoacid:ferredoxin oxidoreductase gamma subunit